MYHVLCESKFDFFRRPTYSEANVDELNSFLSSDTKKPSFGSLRGKSKTEVRNTQLR